MAKFALRPRDARFYKQGDAIVDRVTEKEVSFVKVHRVVEYQGAPELLIELRFINCTGANTKLSLPLYSYDSFAQFYKRLCAVGYEFPDDVATSKFLHSYIKSYSHRKTFYYISAKMGWNNGVYLLPGKIMKTDKRRMSFQRKHNSLRHQLRGNFDSWHKGMKFAIYSPAMVLALGVGLAGPISGRAKFGCIGFYCGCSTALERQAIVEVGASIYGAPSEFPLTEIEEAARGHSDATVFCLDPFPSYPGDKASDGKRFDESVRRLLGGGGDCKIERPGLQPYRTWLDWNLMCFIAGKPPLTGRGEKHSQMTDGHRFIYLPATFSDEHGIYTELPDAFASSIDLSNYIVYVMRNNQGHAIRRFVRACRDERDLRDQIKSLGDGFIQRLIPAPYGANGPAMILARVFASLSLAIRAGVLPWNAQLMETALIACYSRICRLRPDPETLLTEGLDRLSDHISSTKVIHIESYSHNWSEHELLAADAIRRDQPSPSRILIASDKFHGIFHIDEQEELVVAWLRDHGFLIPDRSRQILTSQVSIPGLVRRLRFYVITSDFLEKWKTMRKIRFTTTDGSVRNEKTDIAETETGISFIITKAQKVELRQRGYTEEQIREMKPEDAHQALGLIS
jgi:hypothetical protein